MIEKFLEKVMKLTPEDAMCRGNREDIIAYAKLYSYAWVSIYILIPLAFITVVGFLWIDLLCMGAFPK